MSNEPETNLPVPEPTSSWLNLHVALDLTRLWYAEQNRPGHAVLTNGPEGLWLHREDRALPVSGARDITDPTRRFVVASGEVRPNPNLTGELLRLLKPFVPLMLSMAVLNMLLGISPTTLIMGSAALLVTGIYLGRHAEPSWGGSAINLPEHDSPIAQLREAQKRAARQERHLALGLIAVIGVAIHLMSGVGGLMFALLNLFYLGALLGLSRATMRAGRTHLHHLQRPPLQLTSPRALIRPGESLESGVARALAQVTPALTVTPTPEPEATEPTPDLNELDPERLAARQQLSAVMAQLRAVAAQAPEGGGVQAFRLREAVTRAEDMMKAARHPAARLQIAQLALAEAQRDLRDLEHANDQPALDTARRYYGDENE